MVTWAGRPSRGFCEACATVFRGSSPRLGLPSPPGFLRGSFSSESEVETEAQAGEGLRKVISKPRLKPDNHSGYVCSP